MKTLKKFILYLLPKNLLSYVVGKFASMRLPQFALRPLIKGFTKAYKVNMTEVKKDCFTSFNDFFTRELKEGCRPVENGDDVIVSPVDGIIGFHGKIDNNTLIQAKGRIYTLDAFVARKEYADLYRDGSYLTIYLSPSHYHRIHTPVAGSITSLLYLPGKLYPVNPFAINNINHIFSKNERLISMIKSDTAGNVAVVKVGATNVGKIKVVYDVVESNNFWRKGVFKEYTDVKITKGAELGKFELGSTVVLLFEKGIEICQFEVGSDIRLGKKIANVVRK